MSKILDVNNLRISFRTTNGTVKAVRNISFQLNKGETLAIVGESGSGKSVTSRALMGILAPNAIVESGEILYDGQDLLKIPEEDMHFLRGEKISMIFQDPLSSLNPIIKIGRQLTEAMVIKGKMRQKKMRQQFNAKLKMLLKYTNIATNAEADKLVKAANNERIKKFDSLALRQVRLEQAYNEAHDAAVEAVDDIKELVFMIERNATKDVLKNLGYSCQKALKAVHEYVVDEDADELRAACEQIKQQLPLTKKSKDYKCFVEPLKKICLILERAIAFVKPDFFAIAYYNIFVDPILPQMSVAELNETLAEHLHSGFMNEFLEYTKKALRFAFDKSIERKHRNEAKLSEALAYYKGDLPDKKSVMEYTKTLCAAVAKAIYRLDIKKVSLEYTFKSSITDAVKRYYSASKNNEKETTRFAKEKARHEAKKAKGVKLDWEVIPANIFDLQVIKDDICNIISKLSDEYAVAFDNAASFDVDKEADKLLKFFRDTASAVVHHVTQGMAKNRALKIMEEVGIPEPRKRYYQYPFQFSGGMRQRIVIAIALSVLPDILICDEPTTALDVTIQSQILELINNLKARHNLSVIFITHDLGVVANMADRVAVMYAGKIVEYGTADDIFYSPAHPYTWALLSSMPDLETTEKLESIPGVPPNMIYPPKGDAFAARNKYAMKIDFEQEPPLFKISDTHYAATWLLHPDAPKVEMPKIVKERIERNKKHYDELKKAKAAEESASQKPAEPTKPVEPSKPAEPAEVEKPAEPAEVEKPAEPEKPAAKKPASKKPASKKAPTKEEKPNE